MNGGYDDEKNLGLVLTLPDFERIHDEVAVPEMLAALFSNQVNLNLGQDSNLVVVDLFIVYADLLEKIDEVKIQTALKIGSKPYYEQVLNYGNRKDLLSQQQGDIYDLI